ncbi:hypothetical protein F2Q69_00035724 [Brassica cretica]|uniref:Uncharacterized protein n=1 Tax=Brassica cretica TaxID=69181 RepID=A0A8S9SEX8_BRACR|nr:hypothetical protein F2Q69_00035724 [Brassica cretica]
MFLENFRGTTFLGIFRGPISSEIPDANSEEDFVGTSEDWTIGNFLGIYRGSPHSLKDKDDRISALETQMAAQQAGYETQKRLNEQMMEMMKRMYPNEVFPNIQDP